MKRVYFHNLNGVRFIAAFMVILHHYEYAKQVDQNSGYGKFIILAGRLGVMLFFTLSGFLITYLLLTERRETGTISIKDFYIRRVLRIWPLYYLIVIGSLFIFNNVTYLRIPGISGEAMNKDFINKSVLFLSILPNFAATLQYKLPYADQTWSIGVEEQFYLFIPLLLKKLNALKVFISITIIYVSVRLLVQTYPALYTFISLSCFDVMAIGGMAAICLFYKGKILPFLLYKPIQIACYFLIVALISKAVDFGFFNYEVYSLLFAVAILNLAANGRTILESSAIRYLGKVSYGLYMYHFLAITVGGLIATKIHLTNHWIEFILVLLLTVLISSISYELYESFFIRKKFIFSKIVTGENA